MTVNMMVSDMDLGLPHAHDSRRSRGPLHLTPRLAEGGPSPPLPIAGPPPLPDHVFPRTLLH